MRRCRRWIIPVVLLLLMTACGKTAKTPGLTFTNNLSTSVHNFYVSESTQDDWGSPVTREEINAGDTIRFFFEDMGANLGPGVYDLGVIDENGMNYDIYEVHLAEGDQIVLSGDPSAAAFTVTHADGTSDTVEAYIYHTGE